MKTALKILPWFLLALFGADIVGMLMPKKEGVFHVQEFGRLPVLLNGRIQPFDSVGRNALLQIRGTSDVPLVEKKSWEFWKHPPKLRSSQWLLEVMTRPEQADERPIFLIHHPELLEELNLQNQGIEKSGLRYYTFNEIRPVLTDINKQGSQASQVEAPVRNAYQKQAIKLANAVMLYHRLKNSLRPEGVDNFSQELADFQKAVPAGLAAVKAREAGQKYDEQAFNALLEPMSQFNEMANVAYPLIVPLQNSGHGQRKMG